MKKIYLFLIIIATSFMQAQLDVKDLSVIYDSGKLYNPGGRIDFAFKIRGTYDRNIRLKLYEGTIINNQNLIASINWNDDGDTFIFDSFTKKFWYSTIGLNKTPFYIKDKGVTLVLEYKGEQKKLFYKPSLKIKNLKFTANLSSTLTKGQRIFYDFDVVGKFDEDITMKIYQTDENPENLITSGLINSEDEELNFDQWTTMNNWSTITRTNGANLNSPLFLVLEYKGIKRVISDKYRRYSTRIHPYNDKQAAIASFCSNQLVDTRTFVLKSNDPLQIGQLYTFTTSFGNTTFRNYEEITRLNQTITSISQLTNGRPASLIDTPCRNESDLQFETLEKSNFKSDCNAPVIGCAVGGHYIHKSILSNGMDFKVSVKNLGDVTSETKFIHVYLWANDDPNVSFYKPKNNVFRLDPLNPGQNRPFISFYFDDKGSYFDGSVPAGNYTLQVRIEDSLEGNSQYSAEFSLPFQVRAGDPPRNSKPILILDSLQKNTSYMYYNVSVYSIQGRLISKKQVNSEKEENTFIQNLPKGFYIIKSDSRTYKISK
ncbi:T9SS type A sorting domain-containing protein [uncultured Aquimarina sp.]|uniref:T9SS type A sorting domain-containing protein n=1 Tax=uncultured Aquimarina sp. TaxID=575652 RepID=UPI00262AC232|nr:T9SS type A sorting domain-containing protein [uncultured Aquimarina sp.]